MKTQNLFATCLVLAIAIHAQQPPKHPPPPGVSTPGVKRELSTITPVAIFDAGSGAPDWQVLTEDAVWVTNSPRKSYTASMRIPTK